MSALFLLSLLLCLMSHPAHGSRNRNDILQTLRARQTAIVEAADPEHRLITTAALVRDALRKHDPSKRILIVVPDSPAVRRYRDYFRTASPRTSVGVAGGSLTDSVLFGNNVTLITAPSFVQELRGGQLQMDRLHLLVVDDVSQILTAQDALRTKMQTSRPVKTVGYRVHPAEESTIQALEQAFNGTATQDAHQAEPSSTSLRLLGSEPDASLGLSLREKRVFDATFPEAFVVKSLGGYRFNNRDLLIRAFLHPKYKASRRQGIHTSFQPLDYVGNFVLDFITSRHILKANSSGKSKRLMHGLKAQILGRKSCALYAAENDFDQYVLIDDGKEKEEMLNYATAARGTKQLGAVRQKCFLSKFFEAVAGAIYVDSGYDPDVVERIYGRLMRRHLQRIIPQ